MEYEECYSYFSITSDEKFSPNEISALLNMQPERAWQKGEKWRILPHTNETIYRTFSRWTGCKQHQTGGNVDAHAQCIAVIRLLHPKIAELLLIKQKYHAHFILQIVPKIQSNPHSIFFDREIIEFCYQTDTEIDVDTYIYQDESFSGSLKHK